MLTAHEIRKMGPAKGMTIVSGPTRPERVQTLASRAQYLSTPGTEAVAAYGLNPQACATQKLLSPAGHSFAHEG
jgi:hypothetical protein